MDLVPIKFI